MFGTKVLKIFKGLFQKSLEARFGTQFQHITKNKKARQRRASCMHYQLGLPPQTLTQETFLEKFLGTSKAFVKMKWCCLVRSSWAYFSFKEKQAISSIFINSSHSEKVLNAEKLILTASPPVLRASCASGEQ